MRYRRFVGILPWLVTLACAPSIAPLQPELGPTPVPSLPTTGESHSAHTPSTAVRGVPAPKPPPILPAVRLRTARQSLQQSIDSLFNAPAFRTATWGALVLTESGDTIYSRNAATLLVPASNVKIVTAAAAFALLGPDYRFRANATTLTARDSFPSDFGPMYDVVLVRDRPLRDAIHTMLKQSQNRLAEQIFKTIALEKTGFVARDSSIAVIQRQLTKWGVPNDGYIVYDGSGYDRGNYLSAQTLTQVLLAMRNDTSFVSALPLAGIDGTLLRRMRASSAEANAYAKTGSLRAVRSLSGYVTDADGRRLIFSFLCNAYTQPAATVTSMMDSAVTRLATFTESP